MKGKRIRMVKMMKNSPHAASCAQTRRPFQGKVIVVEVDGVDMKKLFINFFSLCKCWAVWHLLFKQHVKI
jgi:hypothetical protein